MKSFSGIPVLALVLTGLLCSSAAAKLGPRRPSDPLQLGPTGISAVLTDGVLIVTEVEEGSPADNRIEIGDRITGVNGRLFQKDIRDFWTALHEVRRPFADAIDLAETEEAGGALVLNLEDDKAVEIRLPVLGRYSDTAPYDCPKSTIIINRAAAYLAKEIQSDTSSRGTPTSPGWSCLQIHYLALMATGEEKYINLVKERLPKELWAHPTEAEMIEFTKGLSGRGEGWVWGYRLIALAEYHLLTGDTSVVPGMRIYADAIARGQDACGMWGQAVTRASLGNKLMGYGAMNQPSMSCLLGMVLAKKCGITSPEIEEAIQKTYSLFCSYIGRGSLPYGPYRTDSWAWGLNNNGTSASAALLMSMKGNREGFDFFHTCAMASHNELEVGHSTWAFKVLWTPLGVNVGGPEATQAFFKKTRWLHSLYRNWRGGFSRDGVEHPFLNSTGSHLLAYCLPRKAIYLTGKGADESLWLDRVAASEAIAIGDINYHTSDTDTLCELTGHRIPQVREWAARMLLSRRSATDAPPVCTPPRKLWRDQGFCEGLPGMVRSLSSSIRLERMGAVTFFKDPYARAEAATCITELTRVLRNRNEDVWIRAFAARALSTAGVDSSDRYYYPYMISMLLEKRPDDPFQHVDEHLGISISNVSAEPFEAGLIKADLRETYYEAALQLINSKRQECRGAGMKMLYGMPAEDFSLVAEELLHAISVNDPSYQTYQAPQIGKAPGFAALAQLGIREGLPLALQMYKEPYGALQHRQRACLEALAYYGANAKEAISSLRAYDSDLSNFPGHNEKIHARYIAKRERNSFYKAVVEAIEKDLHPPALIPLKEALRGPVNKE